MLKKILILTVLLATSSTAFSNTEDQPVLPHQIKATLLAEITPKGQKVNGIALEYEDNILSGSDLTQLYQVKTQLDKQEPEFRSVLKAYTNNKAEITHQAQPGKFVIIELNSNDKNASLYSIKKANEQPTKFRTKDQNGKIVEVEKVQAISIPQYYNERLLYQINQTGFLKLTNGKTLDKHQISQSAVKNQVKTQYLDDFSSHSVTLNSPDNKLNYQLYIPLQEQNKKYPLTIFLHGSGQVGTDNIAHLLSSKGAISTLQYEQGFVLAPQYATVFDLFDDVQKGQKGGIHWQTENRQQLLLKMIDETIKTNPNIDTRRIYIVGLSRGAEGGLNLLLNRPHFFAGALLMSGREAGTLEWIDGNATKEILSLVKDVPMWFFHSKEDKVSPVVGSRINYQLLTELNAPNVKYTEFTFNQAGDNGIINNNAHNTWDAVFNSPEVMTWLLQQKLN
ncbi:putative peptidase [Cricetibacter osteomyelitidis]|uniref:Putative peptidase n=1 Tax=Cricetibacter osteomyelitidis TaxID=1521931 RepID=A0A4R2TGD6_9PAST|nr:alpha/beta hydrolase-fold protein [Cricetibacter osteomyelitidis]TCP96278.1 putative peptidase [Cricetibacter osteomyelitidis]